VLSFGAGIIKIFIMKREVTILVIATLLLAFLPMASYGQETEKEKEFIRQAEEVKKKAEEEKKIQEEFLKRSTGIARTRELSELENAERAARIAYEDFSGGVNDFFIMGNPPQFAVYGSQNSTSIDYSKSVKDSNYSKDFPAEIDSDAHKASISVSGSCKAGEIRIKITMPSGKVYTEVLIDEYGSVNWTKTFTLDEEGDEKAGTWKFLLSGKGATGNFRVSVRSN